MSNSDKTEGSGSERFFHSFEYGTHDIGSTFTQIARNDAFQITNAIYDINDTTENTQDYISDSYLEKYDEARYNLATHIMSNGVEVIIASDKNKAADSNTALQKSSLKRILNSQANKPMTLAPSTLKNQMILVMPSNSQEFFSIPFNSNHFITKTCLTTYTYRTTYLQDGLTTVESREKVISNIATEERNYLKMSSELSSGVTLTQTPELTIGIYPTTYTFYNTIFDGKVKVISTSEHTIINTVTGPDEYVFFLQSSEETTPLYDTNTYYSKIIITNTINDSGIQKAVTTPNILTQVVVTESLPTHRASVLLQPEFSVATPTHSSATTDIIKSKKVTNSLPARYPIFTDKHANSNLKNTHNIGNNYIETTTNTQTNDDVYIYATKTFLTTFTYFTTTLLGNKNSEEHIEPERSALNSTKATGINLTYHTRVIENVITETVPNSLLKPDLISKLRSDLRKRKNQRRIIVTIATLLGGQALEITATKMINPTMGLLQQNTYNNNTKNEKIKSIIGSNNTFNSMVKTYTDKTQIDSGLLISSLLTIKNLTVSIDSTATLKTSIPSIKRFSVVDEAETYKNDFVVEGSENEFIIMPAPQLPLHTNFITDSTTMIKKSSKINNTKVLSLKSTHEKFELIDTSSVPEKPIKINQTVSTFNLNRLTAFRPVFTAMADLIQSKFVSVGASNLYTKPEKVYINPTHAVNNKRIYKNITASSITGLPSAGPIYIPVQNAIDEKWYQKEHNINSFQASSNKKNIAELSLRSVYTQPPKARTTIYNAHKVLLKDSSVKYSHEKGNITPLINGGIPIRPGEVITANSDVIVGKPNGIQQPRLPYTNQYMDLKNMPANGVSFYKYVLQHPIRNKLSTPTNPLMETYISLTESQHVDRENFDEILTPPPSIAKDFFKLNLQNKKKPISVLSGSFNMVPPKLPVRNSEPAPIPQKQLSDHLQRTQSYLQLTSQKNLHRFATDQEPVQISNVNSSLKQNEVLDIQQIPDIFKADMSLVGTLNQKTMLTSLNEHKDPQKRIKTINEPLYEFDTSGPQLVQTYFPRIENQVLNLDHSSNKDELKYHQQSTVLASKNDYVLKLENEHTEILKDQTWPHFSTVQTTYYTQSHINSDTIAPNHKPTIKNHLKTDVNGFQVQHSPFVESHSEANIFGYNNQQENQQHQNTLTSNNIYSLNFFNQDSLKSKNHSPSNYPKIPAYYTQQKINLNMNALSHNVNINVPPITFKNESDYPPTMPITGQLFAHDDKIAMKNNINVGYMPHIIIPKTQEEVQVNLTPQNSMGSIRVSPFFVEHQNQIILKNNTPNTLPVIGSFAVMDGSFQKTGLLQNHKQINHKDSSSPLNKEKLITKPVIDFNDFNKFLQTGDSRREPPILHLKSNLLNKTQQRIIPHIAIDSKPFNEIHQKNILKGHTGLVLTTPTESININFKGDNIKPSNLLNDLSAIFTSGDMAHAGHVISSKTKFDYDIDTEDYGLHLTSLDQNTALSKINLKLSKNHTQNKNQREHLNHNSGSFTQDLNLEINRIQRPIISSFNPSGMHYKSSTMPFTEVLKEVSPATKQSLYPQLHLSEDFPLKSISSTINKISTKTPQTLNDIYPYVAAGHEFKIHSVNNNLTQENGTANKRVDKLSNSTITLQSHSSQHVANKPLRQNDALLHFNKNIFKSNDTKYYETTDNFPISGTKRKTNNIDIVTKKNNYNKTDKEVLTQRTSNETWSMPETNISRYFVEPYLDILPPPLPSMRPIGLSQSYIKDVLGLSPPPLLSLQFPSQASYNTIAIKHFPLIPLSKTSITNLKHHQDLTQLIVAPAIIKSDGWETNYVNIIQEPIAHLHEQNLHHATPALTINFPSLSIINNTPGSITKSLASSLIVSRSEKMKPSDLISFLQERNNNSPAKPLKFPARTNALWIPDTKLFSMQINSTLKSKSHQSADDYDTKVINTISLEPSEINLSHILQFTSSSKHKNTVFHFTTTTQVLNVSSRNNTENKRDFNNRLTSKNPQKFVLPFEYITDVHLIHINTTEARVSTKGEQLLLHTNTLLDAKTLNSGLVNTTNKSKTFIHPTRVTKLNHIALIPSTITSTSRTAIITSTSTNNVVEIMTVDSNESETILNSLETNRTNQYMINHKPYHSYNRKTNVVHEYDTNLISYKTDKNPEFQLGDNPKNDHEHTQKRILENKMHVENSNSIFIVLTNDKSTHNDSFKNMSTGVSNDVVDNSDNVDLNDDNDLSTGVADRDEETLPNDMIQANHVLLSGVLIAGPPKLSETAMTNGNIQSTMQIRKQANVERSCKPDCKSSRNEICSHNDIHMGCVCRPGFARMFPDRPCKPTYTFLMQIHAYRIGKNQLLFDDQLTNNDSKNFKELAEISHNAVDRMVMQSDFRDVYHGAHLTSFQRDPNMNKHVLANILLQLSDNNDGKRLENVFKKYLRISNLSIGNTDLFTSKNGMEALKIVDFDECTLSKFHDCSKNARCFNLEGTYTCSCHEGYIDLSVNALYPGRSCAAEIIGCEMCNYHGNCVEKDIEQESKQRRTESHELICKCFAWYTGAFCQLNLKILLIALVAIATFLFILLFICILMACTKRRKVSKTHRRTSQFAVIHKGITSKNVRLSTVLSAKKKINRKSSTIDKCAMLRDSSSEASQNSLPYILQKEINGNITKPFAGSKHKLYINHGTHKLDRSLTVMIPRAKYNPNVLSQGHFNHQHTMPERIEKHHSDLTTQECEKTTASIKVNFNPQQKEFNKTSSVCSQNLITETASFGALVSAGFEVSALVGENSNDSGELNSSLKRNGLDKTSTISVSNRGGVKIIAPTTNDICITFVKYDSKFNDDFNLQNNASSHNFRQAEYNTYKSEHDLISTMDLWLDNIKQNELSAEARSFEETTLQAQTKPMQHCYDGHISHTNDEGNTMAEREIGSTFLLPHTHLYKPERNDSDMSGIDSI